MMLGMSAESGARSLGPSCSDEEGFSETRSTQCGVVQEQPELSTPDMVKQWVDAGGQCEQRGSLATCAWTADAAMCSILQLASHGLPSGHCHVAPVAVPATNMARVTARLIHLRLIVISEFIANLPSSQIEYRRFFLRDYV